MATLSQKPGGLTEARGGTALQAADKPTGHEEMGLFVAFVILLAWALYVGLGAVNWSAVKALLAVIF